MNREEKLLQNLAQVQDLLTKACLKSHRNPQAVTLLAVTKYAPDEDVLFFLRKGLISHIGESRVQQAIVRWTRPEFAAFDVVKHFIGHLQHNKAAKAAQFFDFIDSIDSADIAAAIDEHVPPGKTVRGLVQVKLTARKEQSGLPLEAARELVKQLAGTLRRVKICGYMAIAPQDAPDEELQALFTQVNQAFDADFPPTSERYLSLGMSADFEIAVAAGSTLPRIGSRLFAE